MTAILGAGISGLAAAYYALQNPRVASLFVLEASNRVGGWINSKKSPNQRVFEQGPRTIRLGDQAGINTLNLLEDVGLSDKIIPIKNGHVALKNRLIYAKGKLHLLPNNIIALLRKNPLIDRSVMSVICNELKISHKPKYPIVDESIDTFVTRRFGQNVADYIFSPVICGIFGGDSQKLSVKCTSLTKSMFDWEQKYGSVVHGALKSALKGSNKKYHGNLVNKALTEKWRIYGLEGGLEELPHAVAAFLDKKGIKIETKQKCEQIKFCKDRVELVVNGDVRECSRVISSLPAKNIADLVEKQHPELAKELRDIPFITVGVVNLEFPANVLPMESFGFLVPPKEELPILGVIFDSCVFPQNSTVLTVLLGGAWFEKYFGKCPSEEYLLTVAVDHVKKILSINENPTAVNVSILKDCIPQYVVGHEQRIYRIQKYIGTRRLPLLLCGSSYHGIGVNDVILSAKYAVSNITSNIK